MEFQEAALHDERMHLCARASSIASGIRISLKHSLPDRRMKGTAIRLFAFCAELLRHHINGFGRMPAAMLRQPD